MDAPFVEGEDNSLLDVLENGSTPGTDSKLEYKESLRREIERSLSTLTDRQCDVIKLYFGIGVEHPMSLEDIGERFGLTRERVRQIKDKAINKLRNTSRSKLLKNYLGLLFSFFFGVLFFIERKNLSESNNGEFRLSLYNEFLKKESIQKSTTFAPENLTIF
jgi:predicted DNA-binding protein YlxM (UPF0122 family)